MNIILSIIALLVIIAIPISMTILAINNLPRYNRLIPVNYTKDGELSYIKSRILLLNEGEELTIKTKDSIRLIKKYNGKIITERKS